MAQILTPQQIAQYAYNAGFRGAALNQAVAIALAESGGNIAAYNPELAAGTKTGSGSRGLWQIYGSAHPEFNNSKAFDPQVNANAAFKVFKEAGNRFTPWSTFNAGLTRNVKDYASQIKSVKASSSPVAQVARGSTAPIMTTSPAIPAATEATSPAANQSSLFAFPTIFTFLGIDKAKQDSKTLVYDFTITFLGLCFILIAVIMLLVAGGSKVASDNPELVKAVLA